MNEAEVERQIEQMVRFIKQEAEEKSTEIKEFNLEKLQLLEQEKAKIRKEYERKEGQVEVKKKIEYSKQLNEMRLKVLTAKEAAVQEVITEAKARLRDVSKNPALYKKLMQDILVQAMRKLNEKTVSVRCRQVDLMLVKEVLEPARKSYTALFGAEAPALTLDQATFLAPPPTEGDDVDSCGGLVLFSGDGRISCANTLDERLKISYEANLPSVRAKLFGVLARGNH
ncbi:V-type proton ATPase subunit E1 [Tetrabaena socialis]|uniref:V-type proton ATPase subunit E1 n=1 Tax=Tetrabaena socialis TaxID=47790 RepID=A0A2J7ZS81_9CHLO|nr:V-type proton ATPase subunit E1 [Tetrabaena socialis]|eukprot:PNH03090.1 V-type proton ATPase subunit E1 [Tetrabaena socialis]